MVVGSNLFGDILTDLGGALQGSLGLPASANLNPENRYASINAQGVWPSGPGKIVTNGTCERFAPLHKIDCFAADVVCALSVPRRRRFRVSTDTAPASVIDS